MLQLERIKKLLGYLWAHATGQPSPRSGKSARSADPTLRRPLRPTAVDPRTAEMAAAPRASEKVARADKALSSLITPTQPVQSQQGLVGRRAMLTEIFAALEEEHLHVVLYGARGMGKTSLLNIINKKLVRDGWHVARATCTTDTNFDGLIRSLFASIPLRHHDDFRGRSDLDALPDASLASLLPEEVSVTDCCTIMEKVTGHRTALIIDEFDRTSGSDIRAQLADLMKALSDAAAQWQIMLGGVAADISELIEHLPSVQRNLSGIHVPPLTLEELGQFLETVEENYDVSVDQEAQAQLYEYTGGWPYLMSLTLKYALQSALSKGELTVVARDVHRAVRRASAMVQGRIPREVRREFDAAMAAIGLPALASMAKAHITAGGAFGPDILRQLSRPQTGDCAEAAQRIAAEKLVLEEHTDRFGNFYTFRNQSFPMMILLERASSRPPGHVNSAISAVL